MTFPELLGDAGSGHMMDWGGGWMWISGFIMMAALLGLFIWLVRASIVAPSSPGTSAQHSAQAILDERYAKGDISTEDYRERSNELE